MSKTHYTRLFPKHSATRNRNATILRSIRANFKQPAWVERWSYVQMIRAAYAIVA